MTRCGIVDVLLVYAADTIRACLRQHFTDGASTLTAIVSVELHTAVAITAGTSVIAISADMPTTDLT
jgi:hypothetical protein